MSAVSFVVRPPAFCLRCGYAVESIPDPVEHRIRTLKCLNAQCRQYNIAVRLADPSVVLLTDKHDGAVMTQVSQ